jgi:hypothetical protein
MCFALGPTTDILSWHQDIKPSNILVLSSPSHPASPYHYKFKIADFSTSHLKRVISSEDDDTDRDTQGTRTYGMSVPS